MSGDNPLAQVLSHDRCPAGVSAGEQHQELLAPEPVGEIKCAQSLAQAAGDVTEHSVAHGVPWVSSTAFQWSRSQTVRPIGWWATRA